MQIIRAIQKVEDGKVVLKLPAEFAGEDVEIIVLPVRSITESPVFPTKVESGKAIQRFLQIDTSGFTQKQLDAYHHADEQIRKGRKPGEPRILGLTGGLVELAEDFNDPLPDEDLFYNGESTARDPGAGSFTCSWIPRSLSGPLINLQSCQHNIMRYCRIHRTGSS